ncbi:MAG: hypothetical protein ACYTBJ_01455 [Planctomycetota bacterium]|jgi:hypothetical protein
MRIDADIIQDFPERTPPGQFSSARALSNNAADIRLHTNYASLIEQAMQAPDTDATVARRARELLLSGRLESPESTRAAAENIINFGV